ncbi:ABC-2 family transporter protein [Streptacidiphilus jiangxiensis]|uniref:ABC-2 family transporter protein n=2 Tax=Streptacidiphilus jiangxiensis TaxID=235985 RepID=A0A1H7GCF3_STRJI|nr:ABC transporter permease [Streptacidiphilus jiangxiensis]SEK34512.1 ABC-2 family transporter protein [Streptacidiphilus jiangxiensis]
MGAVLRSEWIKVKTVRSTFVTLVVAFFVTVGLSALVSFFTNQNFSKLSPTERATFDPTQTSLGGVYLGQLAVIVFAVLVIGNEYSTGMIRASLAAVPQRGSLLTAKALIVLGLVLPVSLATSFVSFFLGQALLGSHKAQLSDPGVLRAVFGSAGYMTLIALFSLGVGFLLRKPVLSLGLLMPFFFLISPILSNVPKVKNVAHYFPDRAGSEMAATQANPNIPFGPGAGFVICLLWVVAALAVGLALFRRRDA